jgi:Carboxypeptidase regulatory-like domain
VLLGVIAATAAAQDGTGRIEGVVRDAVSHQPVKKASVSINFTGPPANDASQLPKGNDGPQATVTDASGAFKFTNLAAGPYMVVAQHQNYPEARRTREPVQVSSNDTASSVTLELIPGATISGHIVDEDGDPINGCIIQPHPAQHAELGVIMMRTPTTRDDGTYRMAGIPPGKYMVTAQCSQKVFQPRPLSEGPDPPPSSAYPVQYYPAANDAKSAEVMEIAAGAEKSGVDFQMRPVPVTHIHGAIVAGSADWRGRNDLHVQLMPSNPGSPGAMLMKGGAQVNAKDGTFDLPEVFPGSYQLTVFSQDFSRSQADISDRAGAIARVNVTDKPVEITMQLQRAIDISGKVEIERGADIKNQLTLGQINIRMQGENRFGIPPPPTQVNDDGTFTVKSVLPGEWRILVMAPQAFLKSAWLGSDDVTHRTLDLTSGVAAPIRLVISTNTGTIKGTAPARQMVFAETVDVQGAMIGSMGTASDSNGNFSIAGLAPGKYRLVAAEQGSPPPEEGQEVTVTEGETTNVDVKPDTLQK